MIQYVHGMTNKQITSATQTTNGKGKVRALEHDLPRHATHDDADDDDVDLNTHMEAVNLVELGIIRLGEAS